MENNNTFKYSYSAKEQAEIKKLRAKYSAPKEKETNKLEQLRKLDANVQHKAICVSLTFGVIGLLLLGTGMSLIMTDFGKILGEYTSYSFLIGILTGIIGIIMALISYPLYNRIIKKERERIAPEILRLTDELLNK